LRCSPRNLRAEVAKAGLPGLPVLPTRALAVAPLVQEAAASGAAEEDRREEAGVGPRTFRS